MENLINSVVCVHCAKNANEKAVSSIAFAVTNLSIMLNLQDYLPYCMIRRIFWSWALLSVAAVASAQQIVTENGKAYRLHTVESGEGLYRLSVNYNVSQEDIIAANPQLKTTGLVAGVEIRIPLRQTVVNAAEVANYTTYKVQKGETAYSIATQHGMKLAEFLQLNPQAQAGVVEGQMVKILTSSKPQSYLIHTMVAGETLYRVGVNYGVKVDEIIAANPSLDVNAISVGSQIRIPTSSIPTDDEHYYYHRIAAGETLYALCLKYNLLQEKIMEVNPDVDWQSLQVGQVIAVPKATTKVEYIVHKVERGETLYSISKRYEVEIADIEKANEDVDMYNIQRGQKINIPRFVNVTASPATSNPDYVGIDDIVKTQFENYDYKKAGSPTINVAVMLPFNAAKEMARLRAANSSANADIKSKRYVEFYEGIALAADTLSRDGVNIALRVFDVNNRLDALNALGTNEQTNFDLIIGPAHVDEMKDVAEYAYRTHTPVVLPFAQIDSTILENPYLVQASVVDTLLMKCIAEQMVADCRGKHVIMLNAGGNNRADVMRARYMTDLCEREGVDITTFTFKPAEAAELLPLLSTEKENVIFLPTKSEARVNSTVVAIASTIDQQPEARVSLVGFGEWLMFQTIEVEVFHKLNTRIYSTFALDYNDDRVLQIMRQYRNKYKSEPVAFMPYFQNAGSSGFSEYGLWGYDVAMKFIGARVKYGPTFLPRINDYDVKLAQSNFKFVNLTNWGGAANIGLRTITFGSDYTITVNDVAK